MKSITQQIEDIIQNMLTVTDLTYDEQLSYKAGATTAIELVNKWYTPNEKPIDHKPIVMKSTEIGNNHSFTGYYDGKNFKNKKLIVNNNIKWKYIEFE